jgi:hypothetical protein
LQRILQAADYHPDHEKGVHVEYGMGSHFKAETTTTAKGTGYDQCRKALLLLADQYPPCWICVERMAQDVGSRHATFMPAAFWDALKEKTHMP